MKLSGRVAGALLWMPIACRKCGDAGVRLPHSQDVLGHFCSPGRACLASAGWRSVEMLPADFLWQV